MKTTVVIPTNAKIAIIGAGFCGTMVAVHLRRRGVPVILFEQRARCGPGLAYDTSSPRFKLNVVADKMGAFPDDPSHFYRWLSERYAGTAPSDYVPRSWYGEYLEWLLAEDGRGGISRERAHVQSITPDADGVTIDAVAAHRVDHVVLAIGNLPRALPPHEQTIVSLPYDDATYRDLASLRELTIVGTGLTAVDAVLECEARGFVGRYTLLSRHALLPLAHEELPPFTQSFDSLPTSLCSLVRWCIKIARKGGSSQPLIEALRPKLSEIWGRWTTRERRSFFAHLAPYWSVHRHRIPLQHFEVLQNLRATGRLRLIAGRLQRVERQNGQIVAHIREGRGERAIFADRLIRCIGPEYDVTRSDDPLVRSLYLQGILTPGPLRAGAGITNTSRVSLIGSLQREERGEITAVRELRAEAVRVADEIFTRYYQ